MDKRNSNHFNDGMPPEHWHGGVSADATTPEVPSGSEQDWEQQVIQLRKDKIVFNETVVIDLIRSLKERWETEAKEEWFGTEEEQADEKALDEAVEAHKTELGYCCACSYDLACMESRVEEACSAERIRCVERLKALCENSFNDTCWHSMAIKALENND